MNEYEITYLSDPQLSDDGRSDLDAAVDSLIEKLSGSISFSEPNTRRRLFYPIKKQTISFSRTINATMPGANAPALREQLVKQAGIFRVTILKTPRRAEVSPNLLEELSQKATPVKAAAVKAGKPVTMAEVEEKIAEALDEEVK